MNPKIDAVGVTSSSLSKTIEFYTLLGFDFPNISDNEDHVEATNAGIRLMIDSEALITDLLGEAPRPANTSVFALLYDSPELVNATASHLQNNKFTIVKEPWDAFWGQRYCVVEDPDGYRIDLFARL